jgi:hypothetical protein
MLWGCGYLDKPVRSESESPPVQSESEGPSAQSETEGVPAQLEPDDAPARLESVDAPEEVAEVVEPLGFVHTVRWPGESLSLIALWYTGSSANWVGLAKANPKLKPNLIRIGDEIVIPQGLMKNEAPMPRGFLSPSTPKKGQTRPPAPEESEPMEILYAPI